MRLILALMTCNGLSMIAWGFVGSCRFIHERTRRIGSPAAAVASAGLLVCVFGVLVLALTMRLALWITADIAGRVQGEPPNMSAILAAFVPLWIIVCGVVASYVAARLFELRSFLIGLLALGGLFSLTTAIVAADLWEIGMGAYLERSSRLDLLGLTLPSTALGLLLARRRRRKRPARAAGDAPADVGAVAILIPAYNEEQLLPECLVAAEKLVPASQIFVVSDASTDGTGAVARAREVNLLELTNKRGKARALKALLDHFEICDRFEAVLILDADTEIDASYLENALPLLEDPEVVAVAGHAVPKWYPERVSFWAQFFVSYRVRLYRLTQAFLRYGQTWRHSNVSFIVPGFASMYRTRVLREIEIDAPGLIIEDFNMTFEVHRKRLGKIAYSPAAFCKSEEVHGLRDYVRQVSRWYLGLWQTVRRHSLWASGFWVSLGVFLTEMVLQSVVLLALPVLVTALVLGAGAPVPLWFPHVGTVEISILDLAIGIFMADYLLTALVAILERKSIMALHGLGFLVLRWIDAFLFLYTLPLAFVAKCDGRWVSPARA